MSSTQVLNLCRFDMSKISSDSKVVMLGKRKTGKSVLVSDLLSHHSDIPFGTVILAPGSIDLDETYRSLMPSLFIHDLLTPELIQQVVERQMDNPRERAFLVMDDCMFDSNWKTDENIRRLFQNGRQLRCLFIMCMQYALGLPPALRTCIDYVFILREDLINNRKRIYDSYCSMFPSFSSFCAVLDACTAGFECLVVDNTSRSDQLEDLVFWYKAEIHVPPFKIGAAPPVVAAA